MLFQSQYLLFLFLSVFFLGGSRDWVCAAFFFVFIEHAAGNPKNLTFLWNQTKQYPSAAFRHHILAGVRTFVSQRQMHFSTCGGMAFRCWCSTWIIFIGICETESLVTLASRLGVQRLITSVFADKNELLTMREAQLKANQSAYVEPGYGVCDLVWWVVQKKFALGKFIWWPE